MIKVRVGQDLLKVCCAGPPEALAVRLLSDDEQALQFGQRNLVKQEAAGLLALGHGGVAGAAGRAGLS